MILEEKKDYWNVSKSMVIPTNNITLLKAKYMLDNYHATGFYSTYGSYYGNLITMGNFRHNSKVGLWCNMVNLETQYYL